MFSDLRYAYRSLRKAPGFLAASVLIIALGIGAVTAVFSSVEAVLLRPLPFERPAELYSVHSAEATESDLFSIPEFCFFRDRQKSFGSIAAVGWFSASMMAGSEAHLVQGLRVSANTFDELGVKPLAGRLLSPEDDLPSSPRVAVIGAGLWKSLFAGGSDAVGKTVDIDGQPHTIVGILPQGFILPINGFRDDVCLPLRPDADPSRYTHGSLHFLQVIGRLTPGTAPAAAAGEMNGILAELRHQFPKEYAGTGSVHFRSLGDQIIGDSRPIILDLFCIVGALLLLASANLAGLHLVRAIGRSQEFALRSALGASRARLLRLVVAESLILAVTGGVAGILLARLGIESLLSLVPVTIPRVQNVALNGEVFAFAALCSLLFGLAPAFVPMLLTSQASLRGSLAAGGFRTVGGQRRVRNLLASMQVAVALTLLVCVSLFLRSFWAAGSQQLGFDKSNAVSFRLTLPEAGYRDRDALVKHTDRIQARLLGIRGVEDASATSLLPLATGLATVQFIRAGESAPNGSELPSANYRLVLPTFFKTMRIPLREGRSFTPHDDGSHPLVAIIGATLADKFFPNHDALGQKLLVQDTLAGFRLAQIVGVAGDVKQGKLEDAPTFDVYVPYGQMDPVAVKWIRYRSYWVVRGSTAAAALESSIRSQIREEDPGIALSSLQTLEQVTDSALANRRFTLLVIGFIAGMALLLTVAGIYSVMAFGVAQRTREIGVRLALGAKATQILSMVLRECLWMVGLGASVGVIASLMLSGLIAAQLYQVGPRDPAALLGSVILVGVVGVLACLMPARQASRVDPMVALRSE